MACGVYLVQYVAVFGANGTGVPDFGLPFFFCICLGEKLGRQLNGPSHTPAPTDVRPREYLVGAEFIHPTLSRASRGGLSNLW